MIRKGFLAGAAAWMALTGMAAQAQSVTKDRAQPCISPAEAEALISVMLPGALRGLHGVCDSKLPENAYLRTNAAALAGRYQAAAHDAGPVGAQAFARISGLPASLPPSALDGMVSPIVETMITAEKDKLTPATCGKVSRALQLFDPLPMSNLISLTEMIMEVGVDHPARQRGNVPFTICKAGN